MIRLARFALKFAAIILSCIFFVHDALATSQPVQLWSAGMETGDLSEWEDSTVQLAPCGGQFNSGVNSFAVASRAHAHTGAWSAMLSIDSTGGTRLHRWCESRVKNSDLLYSAWFYVPRLYRIDGWANWFQFKSKKIGGGSDPIFFLDVRNRPSVLGSTTGRMYFLLTWWSGLKIEGPHKGEHGYRTWVSGIDIPVEEWVNVRIRYKSADDFSGLVTVWQNNEKIFSLDNVVTKYIGGETQLGINNYGQDIHPTPVVIFIDDVSIENFVPRK